MGDPSHPNNGSSNGSYNPYPSVPPPPPYRRNWAAQPPPPQQPSSVNQHVRPLRAPPALPPRPPPPLPPRSPQPPGGGGFAQQPPSSGGFAQQPQSHGGFSPGQIIQDVTAGLQNLRTGSTDSLYASPNDAAHPITSQSGPGGQLLSPTPQPWQPVVGYQQSSTAYGDGGLPDRVQSGSMSNGSQWTAPQWNASPSNTSQSNALQSNTFQSNALQSNVLQSNVPQSNVPQSNVPQGGPGSHALDHSPQSWHTSGLFQPSSFSQGQNDLQHHQISVQPQVTHTPSTDHGPITNGQYSNNQDSQHYAQSTAMHTFASHSPGPVYDNPWLTASSQQQPSHLESTSFSHGGPPNPIIAAPIPSPHPPYPENQDPPQPPSPKTLQQAPTGFSGPPNPSETKATRALSQAPTYTAYHPQPLSNPPYPQSPTGLHQSSSSYPGSPKVPNAIGPHAFGQSPVYAAYHPLQSPGGYSHTPPTPPTQHLSPPPGIRNQFQPPLPNVEDSSAPVELDSTPAMSRFAQSSSPGFFAELEAPGQAPPPNLDSEKEVVVSSGAFSSEPSTVASHSNEVREGISETPSPLLTTALSTSTESSLLTMKPPSEHRFHQPRVITNESELYARILDPPSNVPAEHASNYYVGRKCSYPTDITYPAFWYRTPSVPDFSICAYCFESHIRNSRYSSMFEGKLEPAFPSTRCYFGVPRVERLAWPLLLHTNNFESLKAYMERQVSIPRCHGPQGVAGSKAGGIKWYSPRDGQILGFVSCEACYEQQIKGTSFALNFEVSPKIQGPIETWSCDLSFPYMLRALNKYSEANMWPSFVTSATRRLNSPVCVGLKGVKSGTKNWFTTAKTIEGAVVCETCYLDQVGLTEFEREFVPFPAGGDVRNQDWNCDFWSLALKVSMEIALDVKDFSRFWETFHTFSSNPLCVEKGIVNGTWYTLKGGCENFDVCLSCYTGWVKAVKLTQHFELRSSVLPGTSLMCDFNPASARFVKYINNYVEAVSTPNFATFPTYVRRFATLPICQKSDFVSDRKWWVLQNLDPRKTFHVCESCYEEAIRGTALAHILAHSPEPVTQEIMCEMYSANMRARWSALSESKTPDIEAFVAYCQHRNAVYMQTVPAMKTMVAQAKARLQQQTMLNAASSFNNGANAIGAASSTSGNAYRYGNSTMGYHWETPYGVQGAMQAQQAMGLMTAGMGDTERVRMLEKAWREVE